VHRFRRSARERHGPVEGAARFFAASELFQQRALDAEKVKEPSSNPSSGSIMASAAAGPRTFATATE
jgi:hypothetical protein